MAISVIMLMTHWVPVPTGAMVTAITIAMWHSYSSRVILAVKAVAMVPSATLQLATIFPVVRGDVVRSSAGLNFIIQLKNENGEKKTSTTSCRLKQSERS